MFENQQKEDYAIYNNKTVAGYLVDVFAKMGFGLFISFSTSIITGVLYPQISIFILSNIILLISLIGAEIGIIFLMNQKIKTLESQGLNMLYYIFAILNGINLSNIYFIFNMSEIITALFATCVFFFTLAAYGYYTKKNLAHWGNILRVAFLSIIFVSLIQFIGTFFGLHSSMLSLLISCLTIIVMSLYVAYDIQMIRSFFFAVQGNKSAEEVMSTMGAFQLYLNFIIIFQHILRIMALIKKNK
jgi:uncharacterized protein